MNTVIAESLSNDFMETPAKVASAHVGAFCQILRINGGSIVGADIGFGFNNAFYYFFRVSAENSKSGCLLVDLRFLPFDEKTACSKRFAA